VEPKRRASRDDQTRDLLGAYALGAVDADEAAALRDYLADNPEARQELAELAAAVAMIPESVTPLAPPPALREKIAAATRPEGERGGTARVGPASLEPPATPLPLAPATTRQRPFWSLATPWAAAAAALLLIALGLFLWNLQLRGQLAAIPTPETIALAGTDAAPAASGEVRYEPESQVMVVDVRDLPPLPAGKVYEVWLIGGQGPVPAGTFDASTGRHALIADRARYTTLAITAEPGPLGTEQPTGEVVATAAL
jgi:anti-sigma-K factor RskA